MLLMHLGLKLCLGRNVFLKCCKSRLEPVWNVEVIQIGLHSEN